MISSIVSRLVILVFGTLYPAYASYKAVRTKNVKEYVKWMMYWIVFALFTCAETFTDVFLSFWFPFYYEIKIILVLWLLSPATKGSSILYRKFVHPMLSRREQEIDEYIAKAKEQGYHTVLHLGTKGVNYATTVLMQTAIKGGGGLVNQLRRSYSLSDLSSDKESDMNRNSKTLKNVPDEDDLEEEETDSLDPRMLRPRGYSPRRSASGSGRVEMYFPEVDVDVLQHGSSRPREPSIPLSHIRSSEDVSSGYSSAEPLYGGHHPTKSEGLAASREPLVRTASVGSTRSMRTKSSRGGVVAKRVPAAEDSDFWDLQGDEADEHCHQEDCFYDVSSSSASQPIMSIKHPVYFINKSNVPLSTVPESTIPLTVSEIGGSNSNDKASETASDRKVESAEDDEDMPLYDAETDEPSPPSKLLPQSESSQCDIPTSGVESPLFINPVVSNVGDTTNVIVSHSDSSPTEKMPSFDPSLSDPHTTIPVVDTPTCLDDKVDEISTQNETIISVTSPIIKVKSPLTESINIGHMENELKNMVQIEKSESPLSVEEKLKNLDEEKYSGTPNNVVQQAHTTAVIPEGITEVLTNDNTTVNDGNVIQNVLNASVHQEVETVGSSDVQDENKTLCISQVDETTVEAQSVLAAFPLTPTPADLVSPDNTIDISTTGDSKYGSDIEQSNNCNVGIGNTKSELGGICIREDAVKEVTDAKDMIETIKETNDNVTANEDDIVQNVQDDGVKPLKDDSGSAYASVESLSPLQPQSRSSSQSSLRKEGRAGRYHKRPAPTPPPSRTSESESDNYTDVQEQTNLESPEFDDNSIKKKNDVVEGVPVPQAVGSESAESAVTARLVLKPGVVRSLGPDPEAKTDVFVSKAPQTKGKKSKSKSKQGDSSLSRLFSLLPFWHGKQESSTSSDTQNRTSGSSDINNSSSLQSSSNSAFVPVQGKAHTETKKQLGKKNRSHSPGQHHQAPLADCE